MNKKLVAFALSFTMSFSSMADINVISAAFNKENIVLAETLLEQLSATEQSTVEAKIFKGRLLLAKEESESAFEYFETLREQHSENIDVNYYLGVSAVVMAQKASIFSKLGYAEDFLEAMEKTITLAPEHLDALRTLIGFHLAAPSIAGGDPEKALLYANSIKKYDEEIGYAQLARVYWKQEKETHAIDTFVQGFEKFPKSAQLYLTRAHTYIEKEQWLKARYDLSQATLFAKDDEIKQQALYQQGKVSLKSKAETKLGIDSLQQALILANDKSKPWVQFQLAQLYIQNDELGKANQSLLSANSESSDELKRKVKKLKKKLKKLMG